MNHDDTIRQIGPMNLLSCGARNFVADTDSLMFQVGSKPRILEKLIVTLVGDIYTVRYVAMSKKDYAMIADDEIEMVHADELGKVVRKMGDRR